jgi:zinc transport system substrate-binding protein
MRSLLLSVLMLASTAVWSERPLRVFVGVPPLQTFVEVVGGDHVQVRSLVQAGQSPHAFEPTPGQVAALGSADLYVGIGIPFEAAQLPRIRAANPRLRVLDAREGLELRAIEAHDHSDEGEDGHAQGHLPAGEHSPGVQADLNELDPHVWTSPPLAKRIAAQVRDALTELDPTNKGAYEANLASFAARLDDLDREIRARLAPVAKRRFMVYHPAWGYFADTYGLVQVPIEKGGKEPGPRSLTELVDRARREGVKVIFVQPQSSRKLADQVAAAIGGRVVVIDPLSADYEGALLQAAREIAAAGGP